MSDLQKNTVQHTLCMPLCRRMIAARRYPELFPDRNAKRIFRELGEDLSGKALYHLQYTWMNCLIRQYNLAWEIKVYLTAHPKATVVELGAGLSCLRRLLCTMAERFPGGMIAFDAVNALGLKGVGVEVKLAGEAAGSYFSLERPKEELESWSPRIVNVTEKNYMDGYLKGGYRRPSLRGFFIGLCGYLTWASCFM